VSYIERLRLDGPKAHNSNFCYACTMPDVTIGLGAAIAALREELLKAIGEGDGKAMRFRLSAVDLSLQVAATKEGEGKIGWKILGLGGSYERSTTQTLNLKLEPVWRQIDGSYTSDFVIADQSEQAASFGPRD
jgi:hypothetical protein